jgi:hypothetical protein
MSNVHFKSYYNLLRAQGRSYIETILIIARKLVRIMFAVTKHEQSYDPMKVRFAGVVN